PGPGPAARRAPPADRLELPRALAADLVLQLHGRGDQAARRLRARGGRRGRPGPGAGAASPRAAARGGTGTGRGGTGTGPQGRSGAGAPKLTVTRLNPGEPSIPFSMARVLRSASGNSGLGRPPAPIFS